MFVLRRMVHVTTRRRQIVDATTFTDCIEWAVPLILISALSQWLIARILGLSK